MCQRIIWVNTSEFLGFNLTTFMLTYNKVDILPVILSHNTERVQHTAAKVIPACVAKVWIRPCFLHTLVTAWTSAGKDSTGIEFQI